MNSCFNFDAPEINFSTAQLSLRNIDGLLSPKVPCTFFCVSTSVWIPILILYQFSQVWNHYIKHNAIESTRLTIFLSHQDHLDHTFSWCKLAWHHWHRWKDARFTPVKNLSLFLLAWPPARAIVPPHWLNTPDVMRAKPFYRHLSL